LKLKGCRFNTSEEIQAELLKVLHILTEKIFQEALQKWRIWWDQSLHARGNYFEGDNVLQRIRSGRASYYLLVYVFPHQCANKRLISASSFRASIPARQIKTIQ